MESEPPDGIEFAVGSSSLLASTALLAARRLFLSGALLRGGLLLPGDLAAGLLRCGLLAGHAPFLRPFFFAAAFFGAALRPAFFFGAAFLRPPARIASASARGCSVVGVSSLLIL